jgi:hypothetical protein
MIVVCVAVVVLSTGGTFLSERVLSDECEIPLAKAAALYGGQTLGKICGTTTLCTRIYTDTCKSHSEDGEDICELSHVDYVANKNDQGCEIDGPAFCDQDPNRDDCLRRYRCEWDDVFKCSEGKEWGSSPFKGPVKCKFALLIFDEP